MSRPPMATLLCPDPPAPDRIRIRTLIAYFPILADNLGIGVAHG